MTEIRLYKSVWQGLKIILLSSVFVVPCAYLLITSRDNSWEIWMGILLFGACYPIGLFMLLDRRPQIIINEIGIYDRNLGNNTINWEIINEAYISEISGQKFICLEVDNSFVPSRTKGKIYRSLVKLNKELRFQELNIAIGGVNADPEKLLRLICLMINAGKPDRGGLLTNEVTHVSRRY